jgi:phospholipase A-2-activating protein
VSVLRALGDALVCQCVCRCSTVKVWGSDYSVKATYANPLNDRGEVPFVYRVNVTSDGLILSSSEDGVVRVIHPDRGVIQSIQHPSVSWGATEVPGTEGDIVTVCQHPATSRLGHAYLWTRDIARQADETQMALYQADCIVPKSKGSGSSSSSSSGGQSLPVRGAYEERSSFPGENEGEQGFFLKSTGDIMMCSWSVSGRCWTDIGTVTTSAEVEEEEGTFDVTRSITMDLEGGGVKALDLKFNLDGESPRHRRCCCGCSVVDSLCRLLAEDPITVTQRFVVNNEIPSGYFDQIRDFVMKVMEEEGAGGPLMGRRSSSSSSAAATAPLPKKKHIPVTVAAALSPIALDKVKPALLIKSDAMASSASKELALTIDERAALDPMFEVLADEGHFHSSTLPPRPATAVVDKCPKWSPEHCAVGYDLIRKMCLHAHTASTIIAPRTAAIVSAACPRLVAAEAGVGPKVTILGLLANLFVKPEVRSEAVKHTQAIAEAVRTVVASDNALIRARAALVLVNAAAALASQGGTDSDASLAAGATAIALAASDGLGTSDSAEDVRESFALALGTAVTISRKAKEAAAAAGADAIATIAAEAAPAGTRLKEVATETAAAFLV